ncbi:MAG: hypothetical protein J5545_01195 [Bacteroidaceae bacterium]|nr:hypothetical protein [Bacteroidaceae bacterium]
MALIAYLQFGDDNSTTPIYNVCDYHYHATRPHNNKRPDGDARCEQIQITVYVPQKSDPTFYEWFIKGESLSGKILIQLSSSVTDNVTTYFYKKVAFSDAFCESITENYSAAEGQLRKLTLSIVASKVEMKDISGSEIKATNEACIAFYGEVVELDLNTNVKPISGITQFLSLETFHYDCKRARNYEGIPFGAPETATLDFSFKLEKASKGAPFYSSLTSNDPVTFSFLFDTNFDSTKVYLHDCAFGVVARGYVIDVRETYDKDTGSEGKPQLMMMTVTLLIANILFIKGLATNSTSKYESSVLAITND